MENLGSREGILKAKTEIFKSMNPDGCVFLNGEDDMLATVKKPWKNEIIRFGMSKKDAVYATDVVNKGCLLYTSFMEYYEEEIDFEQLTLCDPLVINLEGNVAQVSDHTFFFDIDCDGVEDEISKLISGSGFLALDQNGDGIINDGSELFGTQSGNGFADLAKFDSDGNGFIDENDEIFDRLKIWCMAENGQPHLYSLKEQGVGAIGLEMCIRDRIYL